jgi:D-threonate/D-erythronate kinase
MAIVIIADDLSGAAELAGIAFAHGRTAEVQRQFDPSASADVIAVDTDSRTLPAPEAARRVDEVTRAVMASKPDWIFKKTDSVLRGNPAAEIAAMLPFGGLNRAVLVPANPSHGRTIVRGLYLIHGVPLAQTAFAKDPEHPRRSSHVTELLGASTNILLPDVPDAATLDSIARALDRRTLAAGAADFFTAVLGARTGRRTLELHGNLAASLPPPWLRVCGSRIAWPIVRNISQEKGIPVVEVGASESSLPTGSSKGLIVGISERTPEGTSPTSLLEQLARLAADVLRQASFGTVLVEGGATAAALCESLGWTRLQVIAAAPAGIAVVRPMSSPIAPTLLIKPGSYAWPDDIQRGHS